MATVYKDVLDVFESTFEEKVILNDGLVLQWFKMAVGEFSTQIEPLYFDYNTKEFTDINGEPIVLNQTVTNILGFTIKRYYCERQYNKIIKRSNIVTKDLTINDTSGAKAQAKVEIDYVNDRIVDYYEQLKDTAYN